MGSPEEFKRSFTDVIVAGSARDATARQKRKKDNQVALLQDLTAVGDMGDNRMEECRVAWRDGGREGGGGEGEREGGEGRHS